MNPALRQARIVGTLVGCAVGDALGAPYEFGEPISKTEIPAFEMVGGGFANWEPGEWTDDTSMAIPIAQAIARGGNLTDQETLAKIFREWQSWAYDAKDVGNQTREILSSVDTDEVSEEAARRVSEQHHLRNGKSAGNGSLMRTAPVALAYLNPGDDAELTEAARRVSELTHWENTASEACILWTHTIRHAINQGQLDLRAQLVHLPKESATYWSERIDEAETEAGQPSDFEEANGWVVAALQGAWSAIYHTDNFVDAVEAAVRVGGDTDTVAAIAGSLAGAYYGVAAIPARWRRTLHGWPGLNYRDLMNLAISCTQLGVPANGWPYAERFELPYPIKTLVKHPHDEGVFLGSLDAIDMLPDVDAIVSMCRIGTKQHQSAEVIEFWIADNEGENLALEFTLADAANTIAGLRAEGKTVLVHCFAAHSRTPATGALYSALHLGVPVGQAFEDVCDALPDAHPQWFLREAVENIITSKVAIETPPTSM